MTCAELDVHDAAAGSVRGRPPRSHPTGRGHRGKCGLDGQPERRAAAQRAATTPGTPPALFYYFMRAFIPCAQGG
jgi:hypothetical protein